MTKALTSLAILLPQFFYRTSRAIALVLILAYLPVSAFAATIKSFSPASGAPGTLVTIKGTGFTSASTLSIGGKPALLVSYTATQIVGMVMPGAITGKVTIKTGTNVSAPTNFTVTETPYPAYQQGAKLIDTAAHADPNSTFIAHNQGTSLVLSADGNSAIVNAADDNGSSNYLFYTRTNVKWTLSSAFRADIYQLPVRDNNLAISADGNIALIGENITGSSPAKLFKRNNGVWAPAGTLNDSLGSVVGLSADGKTAILGKRIRGGSYGGGGHTSMGITIMKLVGNTWQVQQVQNVPQKTERKVRYEPFNPNDYDENGNRITPIPYYTVGRSVPGSLVAISADGKTAAATSHANYGRYNYQFNLGYTVIYVLSSTGWTVQKTLPESQSLTLSADGNTLLAGGIVYIRNGKTWSQQQQLPYGGQAMSADGNTIVSAAPIPIAYIRTGNGWVQKEIPAPNPAATAAANILNSIALSADGTTAFFGAPGDETRTVDSYYSWQKFPLGSVTVYGTAPYNPLDYATAITFSNTTDKTTTLSWPRGDGSTKRAIFLKMGTAGLPAAIKGTAYAPDSSFMSLGSYVKGSVAATGWYCVYNGTGGYVNITGLKTGTTYTASIVEYTGSAGAETYQVSGVTTRVTTPIVAPNYKTGVVGNFGKNPATMMDIDYFPFGLIPAGVAIFVKEIGSFGTGYPLNYSEIPFPGTASYAANNKFGAGEQIGDSGWFCVYNGDYSKNPISVTGLRPAAKYRIVAVNYNGSKANPVYTEPGYMEGSGYTHGTFYLDTPTGYATALTFNNTTATSSTLSWANGTGASRAVYIKAGSLGAPILEYEYRFDAHNPFTLGESLDIYAGPDNKNWYCVYAGTGNSVNLLGLSPSTTYRVAVVDYNGDGISAPIAFAARFNGANVTTLSAPGAPVAPPTGYATALTFSNTAATATTLSWASSNGAKRAVFLHLGTSGALNVVQGQTYIASNTFKLGSQAGTNGWYCVYNGTGSSVGISGLTASSTYRAIVIEYNGTAGAEAYNLSRYNGANVTTTAAPILLLTTNQKQMLVQQDVLSDDATPELNVHQALSPNGDGVNDIFTIDGIGAYPENALKVLNSNGEAIYSVTGYNNYSKAFDGHATNGTLQKAGTYFYTLEYKKGAELIRKTGYLVLKF